MSFILKTFAPICRFCYNYFFTLFSKVWIIKAVTSQTYNTCMLHRKRGNHSLINIFFPKKEFYYFFLIFFFRNMSFAFYFWNIFQLITYSERNWCSKVHCWPCSDSFYKTINRITSNKRECSRECIYLIWMSWQWNNNIHVYLSYHNT